MESHAPAGDPATDATGLAAGSERVFRWPTHSALEGRP